MTDRFTWQVLERTPTRVRLLNDGLNQSYFRDSDIGKVSGGVRNRHGNRRVYGLTSKRGRDLSLRIDAILTTIDRSTTTVTDPTDRLTSQQIDCLAMWSDTLLEEGLKGNLPIFSDPSTVADLHELLTLYRQFIKSTRSEITTIASVVVRHVKACLTDLNGT